MVNLIKEFLLYRKFKKSLKYIQIDNKMKVRLTNYDKEFERELDNLVLSKLTDSLMKWDIDQKTLTSATLVLTTRLGLIQSYIR
jgi:hypothetical protein